MDNPDNSFKEAVSVWMDQNAWPRPSITAAALDEPKSILIIPRMIGSEIFEFKSARGYFEVTGFYHPNDNSLTSLRVAFMVPGYPKDVMLTGANVYRLSDDQGEELPITIGQDVIKGTLSFQFQPGSGQKDIAMKYSVAAPFTDPLEDTISISPTELKPFFTAEKMLAIPALDSSRMQLEKLKITKFQSLVGTEEAPGSDLSPTDTLEQQLLVKFLDDFAVDGDKVVIETFYPPADPSNKLVTQSTVRSKNGSNGYDVTVAFLSIFELVGTVDPVTLMASVGLFVRVPIAGRVRITDIQGSLGSTAGIKASINAIVAKGSATLTAEKQNGKHVLFIDLALSVKFVGPITSSGKLRLFALPF